MRSGARVVRVGLVGLVALCAAALLARAFRAVDLRATLRAVMDVGPSAPLALLPFMVAMVLDAAGIRLILRPLGHSVSLGRLLPIRIATEALHVTAPAGFVVADSATASLLDTQCGVPVGEGAVLAVARKWLVMRAHAAYIALGAVCGATVLTGVSVRFLGGRWLPWAVCGSALIPLSLSLGLGAGFRGRSALARLLAAVGRIPVRGIRQHVSQWRAGALAVDGQLARIGAARSASWLAAAAFFACWLLESLETAVIVRLVGGPLDLAVAMAAEVGISLVRSIGNVAPAGLGVQEASYVTLLPAMGVPMDTAAAFMLLKRGKELAWIAIGYSLLGAMRRSETVRCARAGELAKI
jgi:uncharacterized membrane protein YbhN (UPF0104 family)